MSGLVMKKIHSKGRSETAAKDGSGKQGGFRNAPDLLLGFVLIKSHQKETKNIHKYKIAGDDHDNAHSLYSFEPSVYLKIKYHKKQSGAIPFALNIKK